jgi:cytochrome b6-f complex iron-sulfur subunit
MTADTAMLGTDAQTEEQAEMSRREFLNYAWLASLGVLSAEMAVVTYQFAMPRLGPGEFGGPVDIGIFDLLPGPGSDPEPFNKAKFWWVVNDDGAAVALYKVCTHLGCIYSWKPDQAKFICPCHGSQFEREGGFILGPAPRSLDQMVIRAYDGAGTLVAETNEAGDPLEIPSGSRLVVETGIRIVGEQKVV